MFSGQNLNRENLYTEFEEIVIKYEKRIFSLLVSLSGKIDEAKDLTQETFIRAFRKYSGFKKKSDIYTWLYRIAVNCWKNRIRYNKRRGILTQQSLDDTHLVNQQNNGRDSTDRRSFLDSLKDIKAISPEQVAENIELQNHIRKCIYSLPSKYKVPVVLYIKGLSYEEISKIVKYRIGTVKTFIFRAKLILKEKILGYLSGTKK